MIFLKFLLQSKKRRIVTHENELKEKKYFILISRSSPDYNVQYFVSSAINFSFRSVRFDRLDNKNTEKDQ